MTDEQRVDEVGRLIDECVSLYVNDRSGEALGGIDRTAAEIDALYREAREDAEKASYQAGWSAHHEYVREPQQESAGERDDPEAVLCAVCGEPKGMHYVMDPPRDAVCPNRRGESDFAPSRPSVDAREVLRRELERLADAWAEEAYRTKSGDLLRRAADLRGVIRAALQAHPVKVAPGWRINGGMVGVADGTMYVGDLPTAIQKKVLDMIAALAQTKEGA